MHHAGLVSSARWYALQVRQRYEKAVSAALRSKGYEEFLPLYRSRRRWATRIAEIDLPLFPGYVFCQFGSSDRRVPIVTTPGVLRIVGFGADPVPVDDREMAAIRDVIDSGIAAEPWPWLAAGQRVRIAHGVLAGLEGIFLESKTQHRVVLSITLLQRSLAVQIDSADVTLLRPLWHAAAECLHHRDTEDTEKTIHGWAGHS
jgi:transcription antitermination factor NusG